MYNSLRFVLLSACTISHKNSAEYDKKLKYSYIAKIQVNMSSSKATNKPNFRTLKKWNKES